MLQSFPIVYDDIYQLYMDEARGSLWGEGKVLSEIKKDRGDIPKAGEVVMNILKNLTANFNVFEPLVNANTTINFLPYFKEFEIHALYHFFMHVEDIHNICYNKVAEILFPEILDDLRDPIGKFPMVDLLVDWAKKWIGNNEYLHLSDEAKDRLRGGEDKEIERLINVDVTNEVKKQLFSVALLEGGAFTSQFDIIFWLKSRGLFSGLTTLNEYILQDEWLHTRAAAMLAEKIGFLPWEEVEPLFVEFAEILFRVIEIEIPIGLTELNQDLMKDSVKETLDDVLGLFRYPKYFNVKSPLEYRAMRFVNKRKELIFTKPTTCYKKNNYEEEIDFTF